MAKFDTSIKPQPKKTFSMPRGGLIAIGVSSIVVAVVILGLSLYEGFMHGGKFTMVELPGFHELKLDTAGLYAGLYQHRGSGPIPVKELSQMEVRIMSKDDYAEVPVLMNSAGQTFERFGMRGLPLFNFVIQKPGSYTMSAVYAGDTTGPSVQALIFPQTARNVKQTLLVGGGFFLTFLVLGIFVLVRLNRWAPAPISSKR